MYTCDNIMYTCDNCGTELLEDEELIVEGRVFCCESCMLEFTGGTGY